MDSFSKLAQIRAKKMRSNKTAEDLVSQTTGPYDELRLDDPMLEEKQKLKRKFKPMYDRQKDKQES
jgi:hypothetical protein